MNSVRAHSGVTPIIVVLAVYAPDERHLNEQIASLARQTHPISKLVAVVADKQSVDLTERICTTHGVPVESVTPDHKTPSVKSFEIGLSRAVEISPDDAVIALCDQDDIWHPEKLAASVRCLHETGAGLAHTDARVVGPAGELRHQSLFKLERRLAGADLRSLLLKNSVTGMTVVMTRRVASASLPFPAQSALFFHHDLWLALVACVLGGVSYVNRPLVDYRQHGRNVIGAIETGRDGPRVGTDAWYRHWAGTYAVAAYLAKSLYIRIDDVTASGTAAPDRERLADLKPYLARRTIGGAFLSDAARLAATGRFSIALQSLMFFCVRLGRLGWALRATLHGGLMSALSEFDRKAFSMAPGAQPGTAGTGVENENPRLRAASFRETRVTCKFDVAIVPGTKQRFVILVPSLNPSEIFAGIATAIDIGIGLARRGQPVLFLATDLPVASRDRTFDFIADRAGAAQGFAPSDITVACGVTEPSIDFNPQDRFLATAWWSAHLIQGILGQGGFSDREFYYLIQDFEPGFYPWGGEYAGALASYQLEYSPIFNSVPLQRHFEELGLISKAGAAFTFHPSIDLSRYRSLERQARERRRLVLYGRPEVPRNMFATALESIEAFLAREELGVGEVELLSVGLAHPDVNFGGGQRLTSLGKIPWADYPLFLSTVDVGLSLMLSPHPSHLPLEMAAAGARVVTNTFAAKDLGLLTSSIHSVAPTASEISRALSAAWKAAPATTAERQFDLKSLGAPLEVVLDALFDELRPRGIELAKAG